MAGEEEDLLMEIEAVKSIYGDDCVVLQSHPPHLRFHVKPRTADISSQQFVEALIDIRTGSQYPMEPPSVNILDDKGLDEQRKKHLISSIQDKASELKSSLMLVALCEEAVEKLSAMNHPDGNCPLCLYPLVPEDELDATLPFMKLMSCFHCFHSECIIRWWKWLQLENENTSSKSSAVAVNGTRNINIKRGSIEGSMGNCPVCRKVFHGKDFEHVLHLVSSHTSLEDFDGIKKHEDEDEDVFQSDLEILRKEKFGAILKLQEENSGLIEPKKDIIVQPGMFLQQPVPSGSTSSSKDTPDNQQREASRSTASASRSSNRRYTKSHRGTGFRSQRAMNPGKQVKQWVKKENATAD